MGGEGVHVACFVAALCTYTSNLIQKQLILTTEEESEWVNNSFVSL